MRASKSLRQSLLGVAVFVVLANAQANNTTLDPSLDPDEVLTVVYAFYGGVKPDKSVSHYVNVTDEVSDLLQTSPDGFSVTEDVILGKHEPDLCQQLTIVYNYEQKSYFYDVAEGAGTVSVEKLKSWAKTHTKYHIGVPIDLSPSDTFHVVFAAYGIGDVFFNVTYTLRELLYDEPDGFIVTDDAMGDDPHPGWKKVLVVIFDDSSGRHLYSLYNIGSKISKTVLQDSATSN